MSIWTLLLGPAGHATGIVPPGLKIFPSALMTPNTMQAQLTPLDQSDPEEHHVPAKPYVPILLTVPGCPRPVDLGLTSLEVLGHKDLYAFCVQDSKDLVILGGVGSSPSYKQLS